MSDAGSILIAIVSGLTAIAYLNLARAKKSSQYPAKTNQRRLIISKADSDLSQVGIVVEEIPIPIPKPGQVLVKVAAVPIHPSIFNAWKSSAAQGQSFGNEGSGLVVASGGGLLAGLLVGCKVGIVTFGRPEDYTAAEYICVDALRAVWSLPKTANLADSAAWFINPFTVLAILDLVKQHRSKAFVHTAASSQLGHMLVQLAPKKGLTVLNVVRRKEHVDVLTKLGAKHIVCQADDDWLVQLRKKIKELNVKVAFDAVAGDMTGQVLSCLPNRGICYVYGVLSGDPAGKIDPIDLIYRSKKVNGFHVLKTWLQRAPGGSLGMFLRMLSSVGQVGSSLEPGGWAATEFYDCTMEDMEKEFTSNHKNGFGGKKLRVVMDP